VRARALLTRAIRETRRGVNLTRYLPPRIADRLAETGLDELRRGRRQTVAILFVDVRGFTPLSEAMTPEALSGFVAEFRHRVAGAAEASGGTIDKFIGDAAMIVFGLEPEGADSAGADGAANSAATALACARRLLAEIAEWSARRRDAGEPPVEVGIGVHQGEVFCGAIGDETRLEFTVLGDPVNVAARLQALTREVGWPIVASAAVLEAAGAGRPPAGWQALAPTPLRGRRGMLEIFGSGGG
jgi:adenylate cyclase